MQESNQQLLHQDELSQEDNKRFLALPQMISHMMSETVA